MVIVNLTLMESAYGIDYIDASSGKESAVGASGKTAYGLATRHQKRDVSAWTVAGVQLNEGTYLFDRSRHE